MIRMTQPAPESFIERVLRLLDKYDLRKSTKSAKLCTSVKNAEIKAKTA